VGLRQGDTALVHSSYENFRGFNGKPSDVVDVLLEAVGAEGNVLMPTMPYTGPSLDYVASGVVFDVKRAVSLMGLVSEVFRRTRGVQRSVHPTHPVAAFGPKASELIADHHLAATPCGRHSPFAKLLDLDGRIVFLGTDLSRNTFFHTVDEIIEADLPLPVFTRERYFLQCKDAEGKILTCDTRLFAKPAPRRRRGRIIQALKQREAWREGKVGGLNVVVLNARDVLAVSCELARRNEFLVAA
jgi:aminoglycoside 3-N-acetyltransferase